jgi:hypothetical protein
VRESVKPEISEAALTGPEAAHAWPENAAEIYREIAEQDRRLAAAMLSTVRETWPASEEQS